MYVWWGKERKCHSVHHIDSLLLSLREPHIQLHYSCPSLPRGCCPLITLERGRTVRVLGREGTFLSEQFSLFTHLHQSIYSLSILLMVVLLQCLFPHSVGSGLHFSVDTVTLCLSYSCSSKLSIPIFMFSVCPVAAPKYLLILFISPSSRCQKSSCPGSAVFSFPHGKFSVY